MIDITDYPTAVLLVACPILWLAARVGVRLSRQLPLDDDMRQDFNTLQAAALTLLGLIIAFSFSLAAERYNQRKNLEEAEANAIGTAYVRAALLPAADAAKLRPLLKAYLDHRIQYYTAFRDSETRDISKQTAKLQEELWAAVVGPATATPTPIVALVVSGMNEVLNAQGYTQAAWWNRIPGSAWGLMGVIGLFCHILVGYGARSLATARRLLFIFPAFIGIAFAFIADIDAPRHGIIRVSPQNLISLANSLSPP
ncbi:hypothetical protein [Reyranella sp.]|uniref:bestrophin-like domain n=1 Tax=Reyranella sp. TaxID=1929291 RepID=UPI003D12BBE5